MSLSFDNRVPQSTAEQRSEAERFTVNSRQFDGEFQSSLRSLAASSPNQKVNGLDIHQAGASRAEKQLTALREMYPEAPSALINQMHDFIMYSSTSVPGITASPTIGKAHKVISSDEALVKEAIKVQEAQREKEQQAYRTWLAEQLSNIYAQHQSQHQRTPQAQKLDLNIQQEMRSKRPMPQAINLAITTSKTELDSLRAEMKAPAGDWSLSA